MEEPQELQEGQVTEDGSPPTGAGGAVRIAELEAQLERARQEETPGAYRGRSCTAGEEGGVSKNSRCAG